ncbi:trans-aconitate 2-methyltransferase [Sulfuricurvum sp.]|uniref:class I SAM-dependent methyltransferase n=1 Tax=Sulfuricurvum sp. TaxID=2025608 RepID=UPI002616DA97|nr:class I SAM-dependent methyltransferase [Sulfuricurvum sp.]MDD4950259.1 class I SAM-dependent methyltransferase [Sulfuricurvum sp.]
MNPTWKPDAYTAHSKGQAVWAKELIEKIGLRGDESILDVGCGDGKITDYLSTLTSGKVVGIDLNPDMIAFAKKQFKRPDFQQMDAQNILFEDRFDVVFSNAALHWAHDHDAVVQGIYKALKSGGKAILQMGGYGNVVGVFIALEKVKQNYTTYFWGFESPYTFCSDSQYDCMLSQAGFSRYRTELIAKDMMHDSIDAFRGWLETTWFPYIQCIPESEQSIFVEEWMRAYLEMFPLDGLGRVHVSMMRLEVEAVKE